MKAAPLYKTKIAFIAAGIVAVLLFTAILLSISNKTTQEKIGRPTATPIPNTGNNLPGTDNDVRHPTLNPQNIQVPAETVYTGTSGAETWKTMLNADTSNSDWQANQPGSVQHRYDKSGNVVVVSWTDPMPFNTAYMWLIGYHHEPFDPVEKFREENVPTILWNAVDASPLSQNTENTRHKTLKLENLPNGTTMVYFYIYKRLPEKSGSYRDYLYGDSGTSNVPFSQSLY